MTNSPAPAIDRSHQAAFTAIITKRLQTIEQPAKRARLEKLLRKLAMDQNKRIGEVAQDIVTYAKALKS